MLKLNFNNIEKDSSITKLIICGNTTIDDKGDFVNIGDSGIVKMMSYESSNFDKRLIYDIKLEEPLYSIVGTNIRDKYDVLNDIYYRYCQHQVLIGIESWTFRGYAEQNNKAIFSTILYDFSSNKSLSVNTNQDIDTYVDDNGLNIIIDTSYLSSVDRVGFISWLRNNNIEVIYELENPILPTVYKGNTIQDNHYPSISMPKDIKHVSNEDNQLEVYTLNVGNEKEHSTAKFDCILKSMPNGASDSIVYSYEDENLNIYNDTVIYETYLKRFEWEKLENQYDDYYLFRTQFNNLRSESFWSNMFLDYNSNSGYIDEGIFIDGEYIYLKISSARFEKSHGADELSLLLNKLNPNFIYQGIVERKDLPNKKVNIYHENTLLSVISEVLPKIKVRYWLDSISTTFGSVVLDETITSFKSNYEFPQDTSFALGCSPSKNATVELKNYDEYDNPILPENISKYKLNVVYEIDIGEDVPYTIPDGIYNVYEAPKRYTDSMTLQLNDEMLLLETLYDSKLEYPTTVLEQLIEIEDMTKMIVDFSTLSQETLDTIVDFYDDTVTCRKYIEWIAELNGTNAFIDYGVISFRGFGNNYEKTISLDYVSDYLTNEETKISRVVYENGLQHYEYGNENNITLYISSDNPYFENNDEAVQRIFNMVNGLTFMSFETLKVELGSPLILLGDTVGIINNDDENKEVLKTIVLSYETSFSRSGFDQLIKSDVTLKTQNEIITVVSDKIKLRNLEINYDRTNAEIKILANQVDENNQTIQDALLDITPEGIIQKINSAMEDGKTINSVSTTLNKDGFTIKNGSIIIQNDSGENVLYGDTNGDLVANKITINSGNIGGWTINNTAIFSGTSVTSNSAGSVALSSANFSRTISGTSRSNLRFAIGSNLGIANDGTIYSSNINITGGSINISNDATIGNNLYIGTQDDSDMVAKHIYLSPNNYISRMFGYYGGDYSMGIGMYSNKWLDFATLPTGAKESDDIYNELIIDGEVVNLGIYYKSGGYWLPNYINIDKYGVNTNADIIIENNQGLRAKNTNGNAVYAIGVSTSDNLVIGSASADVQNNVHLYSGSTSAVVVMRSGRPSQGVLRLGGSWDSNYTAVVQAYYRDGTAHNIVERGTDGLLSSFGWAGDSSYATVTRIRGRTCQYSDSSGTTTLSDENLKKDIYSLDNDKYDIFYDNLKPVEFKYILGTSGRPHFGYITQEVEEALENAGLTTADFGGVNIMPINCREQEQDEEGSFHDIVDSADNYLLDKGIHEQHNLIYTEFIALNTWQTQKLKNEVKLLKEEMSKMKEEFTNEIELLKNEIKSLKNML